MNRSDSHHKTDSRKVNRVQQANIYLQSIFKKQLRQCKKKRWFENIKSKENKKQYNRIDMGDKQRQHTKWWSNAYGWF